MKWIVVKRNYHGAEAAALVRWVVGVEGETRGICECWDESSAQKIALFLNVAPAMYRQIADTLNAWYPTESGDDYAEDIEARRKLYEFFQTLEKMDEDIPSIGNNSAVNDYAKTTNPERSALCIALALMVGALEKKEIDPVRLEYAISRACEALPPEFRTLEEKVPGIEKENGLGDTDPMPWGKHKGVPMQDVPAGYMFWLWTQRGFENNRIDPVADYIRRNLSAFEMEYPDGIWR